MNSAPVNSRGKCVMLRLATRPPPDMPADIQARGPSTAALRRQLQRHHRHQHAFGRGPRISETLGRDPHAVALVENRRPPAGRFARIRRRHVHQDAESPARRRRRKRKRTSRSAGSVCGERRALIARRTARRRRRALDCRRPACACRARPATSSASGAQAASGGKALLEPRANVGHHRLPCRYRSADRGNSLRTA